MAPTPYSCSHQLDIHVAIDGFTHVYQIPCNSDSTFSPYYLLRDSMSARLASDCAADFADLYKDLYTAAASITKYVLQEYNAGSFLPVEEGALGIAGAHAGTYVKAAEVTLTFRDTDFKFYKPRILESAYNPTLMKLAYPTTDAAIDAFIESHLPGSVQTDPLHEWVRSRGSRLINTVTFFTSSFNRRVRRRRGL